MSSNDTKETTRVVYKDQEHTKEYRFKLPIKLNTLIKVFKIDPNKSNIVLVDTSTNQTFACLDDGFFDLPQTVKRLQLINQKKVKSMGSPSSEKLKKKSKKEESDEEEVDDENEDDDDDDDEIINDDENSSERKIQKKKKNSESEEENSTDEFEIIEGESLESYEPDMRAQFLFKAAELTEKTGVKLTENAKYLIQEGTGVFNSLTASTRNPWTNSFTWLENEQMLAIQNSYKSYVGQDLPHELKTKEGGWKPEATTTVGDLKKSPWLKSLGDGPLSRVADDIITHACSYQDERYNRGVSYGYLDDPINLFWDEFKRWATNELSKAPADGKTCEIVKKRIKYLNGILNSDKFLPGAKSQTTMKMVILTVKKLLEETAIPTIIQEILNNSVREHLSQLSKQSKQVMVASIYFLYHSVRCTPDTENFSVSLLQNPRNKLYQILESTTSGQLLIKMTRSDPVSSLIEVLNVRDKKSNKIDSNKPKASINPKIQNSFIQDDGNIIYPSELSLNGKEVNQISQKSGILPSLITNDFLYNYLFLHGLIIELGSFVILLDDAKKLSGTGGELLVYGIANKQMVNMMEAFHKILIKIENCVKFISEETQAIHGKMIMRELSEDKNWIKNYQICNQYHERLTKSLESALEAAEIVKKKASEINIQERLVAAKQATEKFAHDASLLFDRAIKMSLVSSIQTTPTYLSSIKILSIDDKQSEVKNKNESMASTSRAASETHSKNSVPVSSPPESRSKISTSAPSTNPWNEKNDSEEDE